MSRLTSLGRTKWRGFWSVGPFLLLGVGILKLCVGVFTFFVEPFSNVNERGNEAKNVMGFPGIWVTG